MGLYIIQTSKNTKEKLMIICVSYIIYKVYEISQ